MKPLIAQKTPNCYIGWWPSVEVTSKGTKFISLTLEGTIVFKCRLRWHIRTGFPSHIPMGIGGVYTYGSKDVTSTEFKHYNYLVRRHQEVRSKEKWGHGRVDAVYGEMFGTKTKRRWGPF